MITQSGHNMDLEYAHVYNELFSDTKTALQHAARTKEATTQWLTSTGTIAIAGSRRNGFEKCKVALSSSNSYTIQTSDQNL